MAWLKGFTYDGIESLDYDLYITSGSVYDAPERVVDMIKVPGRNGNLAIDRGKFENIDVEYNVYTKDRSQTSFAQNIRDFRNELCSRHEYLRLTDDYNSDEFRLGIYKSGLELDSDIDRAGAIKLVFDCKPQRFLTSGETEKSIPDWSDIHSDSGSIVTIDNSSGDYSIKSLSTAIVPQQDLNGYDNPWAGGAGKNKFPELSATQTISGVTATKNSDGSITLSGTATATTYFDIDTNFNTTAVAGYYFSGIPSPCPYGNGVRFRISNSNSDRTALNDYYVSTSGVVTGGVIADNGPGKCLSIRVASGTAITTPLKIYPMISAVQDDTFAPYENICPITGFDSVSISRTGKNLLNPADTVIGIFWNGNPYTSSARLIVPCESSTDYVLSMNGTNSLDSIYIKPTDEVPALNRGTDISSLTSYSFTTGANDKYVVLEFRKTYIKQADINNLKLQLEHGSTATAYEPFGTEYTVSFGSAGTVYGGTLDVVSGQLTVTYNYVDLGTLNWAYDSTATYPYFRTDGVSSTIKKVAAHTEYPNCICSNYMRATENQGYIGEVTGCISETTWGQIRIRDNRYTDAQAFKTAMNGVQLVYELATPLTYQLTATQVAFLLGTNNIWSNTGDIQIEYGKGGNTLYNPTLFDSRPLIELTGAGTLGINNYLITITGSGKLYIDCDTMEAYTITGGIVTSANNRVSLNTTDYPVLRSGMNNLSVGTGISNVKITPRWWRV